MIVSYLVRDVSPDARCSYPRGRTLLNLSPVFTDHTDAEKTARIYQSYCSVTGVKYYAVRHDENVPFPADQYEQP